jgi:hypothetical protein
VADLLEWRRAVKHDRTLRQSFTCAEPAKRSYVGGRLQHPRVWELDVQSWIRQHSLDRDEVMMLGIERSEARSIGAVAAWVELDGPGLVLLQALAVAVTHRHRGGEHAREALGIAVSEIEAQALAAELTRFDIVARVHHQNLPSQKLIAGAGFQKFTAAGDDELDEWVLTRPITLSW